LSNSQQINTVLADVGGRYTASTSPVEQRSDDGRAPANATRGRTRPGLYAAILVVVILAATAYKLRRDGLFACEASGYGSNGYVAYCQATAYGDYDYGAFWYGLEPAASSAAKNADVLLVGNSRTQFGLSTNAVQRWFESHATKYYLLGFAYNGNMAFAGPLLQRLKPRAKFYVVSVDLFFRATPTPPAQEVMRDSSAVLVRYHEKQFWQSIHRATCSRVAALCRHESAYYRDRANGSWVEFGGREIFKTAPVVYSDTLDRETLAGDVALGRGFVSRLPVSQDCILLTVIPKGPAFTGTNLGTARAIANALGLHFVSPEVAGLRTFDGSHLDRPSAERWSTAFIQEAGPFIQKCLTQPRP